MINIGVSRINGCRESDRLSALNGVGTEGCQSNGRHGNHERIAGELVVAIAGVRSGDGFDTSGRRGVCVCSGAVGLVDGNGLNDS